MSLFLRSWWSKTYNRPLKDPLLDTHTIQELLYEFYDKTERVKAAELTFELEADKIEEAKEQETLDWIEEEERKERELEEAKQREAEEREAEERWMLEQLKKNKATTLAKI